MADLDYFSLSESTLKELAGQGDAEAMIALGIGYYFGSFGEKDVSSAFDFLAEAYRKGDVKAAPFLAEMIYFRQVSISGFDSDEDYCRRAYELYKEGEEIGMIAAIRGLCKMMIRGDYLEEDVNGAYERLKELEDKDEECAHLASLLEEGTLTDDDIVPCNEFEDDEEEESEEADGDECIIRRWLERDAPESDGFALRIEIDDIIDHLDDYIKDDIDEGIFRFNECFSGESVKDLLMDVINSGDEAVEELVALARCYRLMSGADADDFARAAYWAHKAAVLARKGWNDNSLEDGLDLMALAYGELGNVFFSYPGHKDDRFPDVEAAARYYRRAAECDEIVFNYDFNISAGRAYAALGRYEEMKEMFSSKWGISEIGAAWCGQMHYVVGDIGAAMEYWKASLGGYFGWGEYFLGRYQYSHGDSYSAVKNWEKGAGKGNVECHAELAAMAFGKRIDMQQNWDMLMDLYNGGECFGVFKYIYRYCKDPDFSFDMDEIQRNMLAGEALARGMRMFCPYCASLYLDQFKDDGSADIGADKAVKAWGFDHNLLDFS